MKTVTMLLGWIRRGHCICMIRQDVLEALPPAFEGGLRSTARLGLQARDVMLAQITQLIGDDGQTPSAVEKRKELALYLQQALQASAALQQEQDDAFDSLIQQTMELSQQEEAKLRHEEEAALERALQESHQSTADLLSANSLSDQELEALTQQALALSLRQEQQQQQACVDQAEEERLLQEILKRSMYETVGP